MRAGHESLSAKTELCFEVERHRFGDAEASRRHGGNIRHRIGSKPAIPSLLRQRRKSSTAPRRSPESLYPHSFNVSFDDVLVFKIGQPRVPDSCLPLDAKKDDSATKVVSVALDMDLLHCVCGLSLASGPSEDLARTNVAGFVVVTDVSMEKRTLTLLSPAAHPLPRNCLLISDIRFVDMK